MKKILVVVIAVVIPLLLVGPIIYERVTEVNRLKTVEGIRQQVAKKVQDEGTPLEEILSMAHPQSRHLTLVYTGKTRANLEPCGCYVGQSGGVSRRRTAIFALRAKGWNPLVLDAGHFVDGKAEIDRLRSITNMKAMAQIGYDAIGVSNSDFAFGPGFLETQATELGLPLIWENPSTESQLEPCATLETGGVRVLVLSASDFQATKIGHHQIVAKLQSSVDRHRDEVDVSVLLSSLPIEETRQIIEDVPQLDIAICTETQVDEVVGRTYLLGCVPDGELIGFACLKLTTSGEPLEILSKHRIRLSEAVANDPEIDQLLGKFYQQIEENAELHGASATPRFASLDLEKKANSSYAGSRACQSCHREEYQQWETTPHARAWHTLKNVQRYFDPECVSCHVVGYGYETGYKIAAPVEALQGVGCETCHGPGKQHVLDPVASNIRGKIKNSLCFECHNAKHSPGFDQLVEHVMPDVDHSRPPNNFGAILSQRTSGTVRLDIDLFVMSFCPFGTRAEKSLLPTIEKYKSKVDFSIHFIVSEKTEETSDKASETYASVWDQFESLHGEREVVEDMRQVVIAKLYSDQLFDYLLWRADHQNESWRKGARRFGIDPDRVTAMIQSDEGLQWFRENIAPVKEFGIRASPTLWIDGYSYGQRVYTTSDHACRR